jgi:hypothetical protein
MKNRELILRDLFIWGMAINVEAPVAELRGDPAAPKAN